MNKIEETKQILEQTTTALKDQANKIKSISSLPELAGWKDLKPKDHKKQLDLLGFSNKDIFQTISICLSLQQSFPKEITILSNEIGNLRADLITKVDENQAHTSAKKLERHYAKIEKKFSTFFFHANKLIATRKQLTHDLTIDQILPLARFTLGPKREVVFDDGVKFFSLFSSTPQNSDCKPIGSYLRELETLENRYKNIEVPNLPNLAEEVVYHQIELGLQTINLIRAYISAIESQFTSELITRNLLEQKLKSLYNEPSMSMAMDQIEDIARETGHIVIKFCNKEQVPEFLAFAIIAFEHLNIFHLTIKHELLGHLAAQIATDGSKINPQTAASKNTKNFFFGVKGIINSLKLMVISFKGQQIFNELELQLILEKSIHTCRIFYAGSENHIAKLIKFIDALLIKYERPFPYEQLFNLVKYTLANYGAIVEKEVYNFKINSKYRTDTKISIPSTLGKLAGKLEEKNIYFHRVLKSIKKH